MTINFALGSCVLYMSKIAMNGYSGLVNSNIIVVFLPLRVKSTCMCTFSVGNKGILRDMLTIFTATLMILHLKLIRYIQD
jgi:hypothetical protein